MDTGKKEADFFKSLTEDQKNALRELIRDVDETLTDSVCSYFKVINCSMLHGSITNVVYSDYVKFCGEKNLKVISNIEFSRRVVKAFPVRIVDTKIHGKKCRVFMRVV